jgi:hypothetical protein
MDIKMHGLYSNNPKGKEHLKDISIDRKVILKWVPHKCFVTMWIGASGRILENINESSGSIKGR